MTQLPGTKGSYEGGSRVQSKRDDAHNIKSVSKSFISALVGIALDKLLAI